MLGRGESREKQVSQGVDVCLIYRFILTPSASDAIRCGQIPLWQMHSDGTCVCVPSREPVTTGRLENQLSGAPVNTDWGMDTAQ